MTWRGRIQVMIRAGLLLSLVFLTSFLVSTCKSEIELSISASPESIVKPGTDLTLEVSEASGSNFENIRWSIWGAPLSACDNETTCIQTMDRVGTFHFEVEAEKKDTLQDTIYNLLTFNNEEKEPDQTSLTVEVSDEAKCKIIARDNGGSLVQSYYNNCLIKQTSDHVECRRSNYAVCVNYLEASNSCPGNWRLPTASEWTSFGVHFDTAFKSFCFESESNCSNTTIDGITYKPYNYALNGGSTATEVQVGKWLYSGWFIGDRFRPETEYFSKDNRISVRCVQKIYF